MTTEYANLPSRVKALVIDQIIVIALMYVVSELFGIFSEVSNTSRILALVLIFFVYEPLFVSLFGGSIGHSYSKITVRSENDESKKIPFVFAVLRLLVKLALGWVSLLTVTGSEKKKAIHDMVAQSVILDVEQSK